MKPEIVFHFLLVLVVAPLNFFDMAYFSKDNEWTVSKMVRHASDAIDICLVLVFYSFCDFPHTLS